MNGETFDSKSDWHLSQTVPIGLIIGLFVQAGGLVWYAATAHERLNAVERSLLANRDISMRVAVIEAREAETARRLERMEGKIDRLLEQQP